MASPNPSGSDHGKGGSKKNKRDESKVPGTGPTAPNQAANFWKQPMPERVKQGTSVALPTPFSAPSLGPFPDQDTMPTPAPTSSESEVSSAQANDLSSNLKTINMTQTSAPINSASGGTSSTTGPSNAPAASPSTSSGGNQESSDDAEEAHNTEHADLDPDKAPVVYASQPPVGRIGSEIKVRTNMIKMQVKGNLKQFHVYSFSFPPISGRELKNRGVRKSLIQGALLQGPFATKMTHIATDWSTLLVSTVDLGSSDGALTMGNSKFVDVNWQNQTATSPQIVTLEVKLIHVLPMIDLWHYWHGHGNTNVAPHLAALNILARKAALYRSANVMQVVKVGRDKFFWQQHAITQWTSGLEPRAGFSSSVLALNKGISMNIHNVSAAFITGQPLLDYVYNQTLNIADPGSRARAQSSDSFLKSTVNQLQVRLCYAPSQNPDAPTPSQLLLNPLQGHLRRINGFGASARLQRFTHNALRQQFTVETYYNTHVLLPADHLTYPYRPVVNVGSRNHPVWVPPELLYIEPHQPLRGQLDDTDMANMLTFAQHRPHQNVAAVERAVSNASGMFDRNVPQWSGVGLSIDGQMMEVQARMLAYPALSYGGNSRSPLDHELQNGKWNLRDKKFHTPARLSVLGVVEIGSSGPHHLYNAMARALTDYGITSGVNPRGVNVSHAANHTTGELKTAYNNLSAEAKRTGVILVKLPDSGKVYDQYASIKAFFDTRMGLQTVCITGGNLRQLTMKGFQANLALKFNVKLGGINHVMGDKARATLHSKGGATMVVGADVTHPEVGAIPHCPSIAALVATCDKFASTYPGSMRLQRSKQEEIHDLEDMMTERLALWANRNAGELPTDILFYRDGVSDSQFAMVKEKELPKIRLGCQKAGRDHQKPDYKPKITLITCGKRHHTRFYPTRVVPHGTARFVDNNTGNFVPGLVVDDVLIRNPYTFDFYLQSQKALAGTARPCHYFVIENESEWASNALQSITFFLCWIFATALTPISYASPAYYADRLCERGRRYLWPLLKKNHPQRPHDDDMLNGFVHPAVGHASEDQKHDHALQLVQSGTVGDWQAQVNNRKNPYTDSMKDVMFYV